MHANAPFLKICARSLRLGIPNSDNFWVFIEQIFNCELLFTLAELGWFSRAVQTSHMVKINYSAKCVSSDRGRLIFLNPESMTRFFWSHPRTWLVRRNRYAVSKGNRCLLCKILDCCAKSFFTIQRRPTSIEYWDPIVCRSGLTVDGNIDAWLAASTQTCNSLK